MKNCKTSARKQIRENLHGCEWSNYFSDMTQKASSVKETDRSDFIRIENSALQRYCKTWKGKPQSERKRDIMKHGALAIIKTKDVGSLNHWWSPK